MSKSYVIESIDMIIPDSAYWLGSQPDTGEIFWASPVKDAWKYVSEDGARRAAHFWLEHFGYLGGFLIREIND